jgi:hypothetical protein
LTEKTKGDIKMKSLTQTPNGRISATKMGGAAGMFGGLVLFGFGIYQVITGNPDGQKNIIDGLLGFIASGGLRQLADFNGKR